MIARGFGDVSDPALLGGKGRVLEELRAAGFEVPEFFVALPGAPDEEILAAFDADFGAGERVAVRSSAVEEDGTEHSFAGQFETFLEVGRDDLAERCGAVWESGASERVRVYHGRRGASGGRPAALVQRMLSPDASGVAFSADPVSGRRGVAVVAAVRGLGEKLVSGRSDAETWEAGRGRPQRIGENRGVLTEAEAGRVAALARSCEDYYERPQDIEWALEAGRLWLLQSRPITSMRDLPDPDQPLRIWDNSNIAESYPGVSSPLTYTFARRAYEHVYRQFCHIMAVPRKRVARNESTFRSMIGQVRGRIYYNLVSWYRLLGMLPGFALNRPFMEQMMGVKEPMPEAVVAAIEAENRSGKAADLLRLTRTAGGLVWRYLRLRRSIERFFARLRDAMGEAPEGRDEYEWLDHYRELEGKLLERWDAPLVNDFFAMIFSGVLRTLCSKWCGDAHGELANRLLRDLGDVVSAEPARRIRGMAERAAAGESIEADFAAFLETFGDRCFEELKLESPTLRDDPGPLRESIEALAGRLAAGEGSPGSVAGEPAGVVPDLPFVKGLVFRWVLREARSCVRHRENLRFERTRVFGRVRRVMRTLGARLAERGLVAGRDDVFYLQLEEILAHFENTSPQPISEELVRFRKREWQAYRAEAPPPDRFQTHGAPGACRQFEDLTAPRDGETEADADGVLRGLGACAGVVRGKVRVVDDPRNAGLRPGEILVALQTDPGWVVLFPAAAGLLVERGSLLSHSAIVAREMGIPAIVSIPAVTKRLATGQEVEMNGATGEVRVLTESS